MATNFPAGVDEPEPIPTNLGGADAATHSRLHRNIQDGMRAVQVDALATRRVNRGGTGQSSFTAGMLFSNGGTSALGTKTHSQLLNHLGIRYGTFDFTFHPGQPQSVVHTLMLDRPILGISVQLINGSSLPLFVVQLSHVNGPGAGHVSYQARWASGATGGATFLTPCHYLAFVEPI